MRVGIDFETAYGTHPITRENISLTRLTTEEYVRHPLFKIHGVGIKVNDNPTKYFYGRDIKAVLGVIPWDECAVVAHHAHFDGAILNWIYGIRPMFWIDTLSMANALFPWASSSLSNLCKLLGVRPKGTELVNFKNLWVLTAAQQRELGDYCCNDVDIMIECCVKMMEGYPADELRLIDTTIRWFTEPIIEIDGAVLVEDYRRELKAKRAFMKKIGTDRATLMSNPKFAALLHDLGVDPPMKTSPATGKRTYAFAKADEEFKRLLDHPDENVRWAVEARMSVKSTIKETRSKRFYKIGKRGKFPVYLKYYGAHTGRWSGGDKQNPQNMVRYNAKDPTSGALRRSFIAPEGMVCVVRDSSQIEARMLAYVAGQMDLLHIFATGGDPYDHMASQLYGRLIQRNVNPDDKVPGQVGKAVTLGCGYQMGAGKFQESLRVGFLGADGMMFDETFAAALNVDVAAVLASPAHGGRNAPSVFELARDCCPGYLDLGIHCTHYAVTKTVIDRYRATNDKIVDLWNQCDKAIMSMLRGNPVEVGELVKLRAAGDSLYLPNGMRIQYHDLAPDKTYITDAKRSNSIQRTKIYGGKMTENIIQALSRIVLGQQLLRVRERYPIATTTHDEMLCIAPIEEAEEALEFMGDIMGRAPAWCADLPLASNGGYNRSYGLCDK